MAQTSPQQPSLRVEHDRKKRQFFIRLNDPPGPYERAVLLYEYVGKKTVDLQHTEVPDAYRGRGIGKLLAKGAAILSGRARNRGDQPSYDASLQATVLHQSASSASVDKPCDLGGGYSRIELSPSRLSCLLMHLPPGIAP
nr:PREDICTED: uncharacterized protein LOC102357025 isoform X1 [Latimeria chalumnae]|eukprot:XP_014349430.1 PREDICTED: uncharacterized protein LOC102357025 isoform X1 [Latimeria chalumnae]